LPSLFVRNDDSLIFSFSCLNSSVGHSLTPHTQRFPFLLRRSLLPTDVEHSFRPLPRDFVVLNTICTYLAPGDRSVCPIVALPTLFVRLDSSFNHPRMYVHLRSVPRRDFWALMLGPLVSCPGCFFRSFFGFPYHIAFPIFLWLSNLRTRAVNLRELYTFCLPFTLRCGLPQAPFVFLSSGADPSTLYF